MYSLFLERPNLIQIFGFLPIYVSFSRTNNLNLASQLRILESDNQVFNTTTTPTSYRRNFAILENLHLQLFDQASGENYLQSRGTVVLDPLLDNLHTPSD
jgi:hypothetical protein